MDFLFIFIYLIIFDYLFFGITSMLCGRACNYNCKNCKNWACTHGVEPRPKIFYQYVICQGGV